MDTLNEHKAVPRSDEEHIEEMLDIRMAFGFYCLVENKKKVGYLKKVSLVEA